MKVEYFEVSYGTNINNWTRWRWHFNSAMSKQTYTRRRDAVRGFERFCAAIKKAGKV